MTFTLAAAPKATPLPPAIFVLIFSICCVEDALTATPVIFCLAFLLLRSNRLYFVKSIWSARFTPAVSSPLLTSITSLAFLASPVTLVVAPSIYALALPFIEFTVKDTPIPAPPSPMPALPEATVILLSLSAVTPTLFSAFTTAPSSI